MFRKIIRSLKGDRKYFTIVFFILFLVLLIGIITPIVIDIKESNWNEELEEEIKEIEISANGIFNEKESDLLSIKSTLKKELDIVLSPPNTSYRRLIRLVNEERFSKYSVEVLAPNGRIIAWNKSIAVKQEEVFPLTYPLGQTYFHNTELVTYLSVVDTLTLEHDNFYLVLSAPVEKYFSLQNPYYISINFTEELNENFYTQFEINYNPFSEKSKDGRRYTFDLLNNKNNKIGIVSFYKPTLTSEINSANQYSNNLQVILVVIAFFLAGLGFRKDFHDLKYRTLKIFILFIYLSLLRILLYSLNFPSRFLEGVLVDPAYFSSAFAGGIVKSPIEFFLTALLLLILSVYIFRNVLGYIGENVPHRNKIFSSIIILLFTIIFFLSIRAVAATIKSIIFDSAIRYFKEPELIPDLPSLSMNLNVLIFGLGSILLLSSFILIIVYNFKSFVNQTEKKLFISLFILFEILGIGFYFIQKQPLITPLLILLIVGFIFLLSYFFYKKGFSVYNYVYATLAASVV
ncbi:MAG TPA: hypothetical protein VLN45_00910, partial [Ignavibacteriaceae bacterium]|nr:hypothetical protein [Ignavibacteriaceae bacterium]